MKSTEEILNELKELEAKATAGPWQTYDHPTSLGIFQTAHITRDLWTIPKSKDDSKLIAESRTMLPRLIESLEDAQGSLRCAFSYVTDFVEKHDPDFEIRELQDLEAHLMGSFISIEQILNGVEE